MKIQTIFATGRSVARPAQGQNRAAQAGFTMVELLTVLAILGVLIALATPSMTQFIAEWRVNSALNSLSRDFRAARSEAIKRSRPVVICKANASYSACVTTGNTSDWQTGWLVFVDNDFDDKYDKSKGDELVKQQNTLPGIASFVTQSGSAEKFIFVPNGLMKGSGNAGFNIQSALGGQALTEKHICVARSGRLRQGMGFKNCTS